MFSKLFKSNKNVTKGNLEKLNSNELKNVIGGGDPIPGVDVSIEQVPYGKPIIKVSNINGGGVNGSH